MTAIAYRNGILATDSAIYSGSIIIGYHSKVRRLPDGRIFAGAGHSAVVSEVARWLSGEINSLRLGRLSNPDDFDALLIEGDGTVYYIDGMFLPYKAPNVQFHAAGSHASFLLGAMAAGASAEEAIRLATTHTDAAGEVHIVRLKGS